MNSLRRWVKISQVKKAWTGHPKQTDSHKPQLDGKQSGALRTTKISPSLQDKV